MAGASEILVRGRCACGRRYRVRHAHIGTSVACPLCGRSINITEADLKIAGANERLIPLQSEAGELREVVLVDRGDLRLAKKGARPGLTGRVKHDHEEAQLAAALRGWSSNQPVETLPVPGGIAEPEGAVAVQRRSFFEDCIASFYLVGSARNALNLAAMAVASSLFTWVFLIPGIGPLRLVGVFGCLIVAIFAVEFYWNTLRDSAFAEDEIPWSHDGWDLWEDALYPTAWLIAIGVACSLPAWLFAYWAPAGIAFRGEIYTALMFVGWFFWPVAVMSVALGNTILFARPDWLVRCVIGIGPLYVLPWLLVTLLLVVWRKVFELGGVLAVLPLIGPAVNLYIGYVLFRTLGLLFKHFRHRLPWKY